MRFHPALGDPEGLNERERGLFESEGFAPLPPPGPEDWRAVHPEPGQSFTEFLESDPPFPTEERRVLYLRPVGTSANGVPALDILRDFTEAFFRLETKMLPPLDLGHADVSERPHPAAGQRQPLAPEVIDALTATMPNDAFCVVGLTVVDLYPEPSWSFVFGQAAAGRRAGVYSFFRYDGDEDGVTPAFLHRCAKVVAHESCHLFGMAHCPFFRCLMNGSNNLAETDARPLHLCPVCLRKLAFSVGFDVRERYQHLAGTLDDMGLRDEAEWFRERLAETPGAFPMEWSP